MQRDWEIARWQILHFVAPYSKKRLTSKDIAVFGWEKPEVKPIPKREDVIDTIEKWKRWEEKHKSNG